MLHALRPRYSSITIQNKDDLVYHMTAHLRMNAVYWGLTALCVMKNKDALNREEMIDFVMSCWDEETGCIPPRYPCITMLTWSTLGGFGAHPDHDAHLLPTLSAIQILVIQDALDRLDIPRVIKCMPRCSLGRYQHDPRMLITLCHSHFVPSTRVRCLRRRPMGGN